MFENDVELYGTQTKLENSFPVAPFENDVELYGTQTSVTAFPTSCGLRMM